MKEVTISQLKQMSAKEIREEPSLKLVADGELVAHIIVGAQGEMKTRIEAIASMIDAGRGK